MSTKSIPGLGARLLRPQSFMTTLSLSINFTWRDSLDLDSSACQTRLVTSRQEKIVKSDSLKWRHISAQNTNNGRCTD